MDNGNKKVDETVKADNGGIAVGNNFSANNNTGTIHFGNVYGLTKEETISLFNEFFKVEKKFTGKCPYKGLEYFTEDDADLFFGRETLVNDLVKRVQSSRTLFVSGSSGSGKSSLVRAGLIPALRNPSSNSATWEYESMMPGSDPFAALATSLSRVKMDVAEFFKKNVSNPDILHNCAEAILTDRKDQRFVLFIDQFEEIFAPAIEEEKRLAFINLLTNTVTKDDGRVIILFTMRADFIQNCAKYSELKDLFNQQSILIGAMEPAELVKAILLPAQHEGLRIEPALVSHITHEMKGEPGVLPLMQFALKNLYDHQYEKKGAELKELTLEAYTELGGIYEALENHAKKAYESLDDKQKALMPFFFKQLIDVGSNTQQVTKRIASFNVNELTTDVKTIIDKFADQKIRLITTGDKGGETTVTLSHEKLIEAWPWLAELIEKNREAIALQNEIDLDAKEWDENKRNASYLYPGARLEVTQQKINNQNVELNPLAKEFIAASIEQEKARTEETKQLQEEKERFLQKQVDDANKLAQSEKDKAKSNQRAQFVLIAGIIIAAVLAFWGWGRSVAADTNAKEAQTQAAAAQAQATISRAGELAAQSEALINKDFRSSLLLGVESFRLFDNLQSRTALFDTVNAHPGLERILRGHSARVFSVAFSPDGKTLASGSEDNTIILWDVATGKPIGQPLIGHKGWIASVTFSPDGKILASGSDDKTIILWDVATGIPIGKPLTDQTTENPSEILSVAFSPDGKTLASGSFNDNSIILWDVTTVAKNNPKSHRITGDLFVTSLAFSPDGETIAAGSYQKTIILWDVKKGQQIDQPLAGTVDTRISDSNDVFSVAFSPDGKTLASGNLDGTVILWNTKTHKQIGEPLTGHTDIVNSVAFSPDGKILASGSDDKTIILWDVEKHQPVSQSLTGHSNFITSVAFSPDKKIITLASGSYDNSIILWNVSKLLDIHGDRGPLISQQIPVHAPQVESIAVSPDGKTLASGDQDGTVILWNTKTNKQIGTPLKGHTSKINSIAFSPDGKILASGSDDNNIILWNIETHQQIGNPLTGLNEVYSVAFSTDGKTLVSISGSLLDDKTITLWNTETHQQTGEPHTAPNTNFFLNSIAISPDGKTIALNSHGYTIILQDAITGKPIGQPLTGHANSIVSLAFSPDGNILASGSWDKTIILWDVNKRQPIGQIPLTKQADTWISSVAFSPNGKTLVSGAPSFIDDKTFFFFLFDLDPASWITQTCQRAGSNFTRVEWERYFPNEPYRKTCDQWQLEPEITATPTATP